MDKTEKSIISMLIIIVLILLGSIFSSVFIKVVFLCLQLVLLVYMISLLLTDKKPDNND